jgi:hypothetical protein
MRKGKGNKANKILPIFIVLIMVGSLFMVFNSGGGEVRKYNDIVFKQTEQGWVAKIYGKESVFAYHPEQLEDIESNNIILKGTDWIITFNSSESSQQMDVARLELTKTIKDYEFATVQNIPDLECGWNNETIIMFKLGNETKIIQDNDCTILEATYDTESIRVMNKLQYILLGVMD